MFDPFSISIGVAVFRGISALINDNSSKSEIQMQHNVSPIRVLVFGTAGTGKTSLCNALTRQNNKVGDGVLGVTFETCHYSSFKFDNGQYVITDTVGLNESAKGKIPSKVAFKNLLTLLKESQDGYSLLIHVFRIPRITQTETDNFDFFVKAVCESKIPVLLVATGCENREPMSQWAEENSSTIKELGLDYNDIVCTSFAISERPALAEHFNELREESRLAVFSAIKKHALPEPHKVYDSKDGFLVTVKRAWNIFCRWAGVPELTIGVNERFRDLLIRLGWPKDEAEKEAEVLTKKS